MIEKTTKKVIDHILSQGYFVTTNEPTDQERATYPKIIKIIANESGINAQRTSMDLPIIKRLLQLYKRQLKTK
jgi:hypothetical protein